MAEIIQFKDGSKYALTSGAFLDDLIFIAESEEEANKISNSFTKDNISSIEFYHEGDDKPYKLYKSLKLISQPTRQNEIDVNEKSTGRIIVKASLRVQTDLERRVSELETAQINLETAITEVYESIGLKIKSSL